MFMLHLFLTVMAFNVTFNNISVISCRSVLLVEVTGVPGENHCDLSMTNLIILSGR